MCLKFLAVFGFYGFAGCDLIKTNLGLFTPKQLEDDIIILAQRDEYSCTTVLVTL